MEPILLIHGYGAEARTARTRDGAASIYGNLPTSLRRTYGAANVLELNLARYVSLDDGIGLDDISRALDRALRDHPRKLLDGPFHVITHSTGALVVRNWVRRFGGSGQPLRNLVHLAGANFGSGWAHLGQGQLARWGRRIFSGTEAGMQVLDALELGSSDTIDLHLHFLDADTGMVGHYGVRESVITGSQADAAFFSAPVRYAKEDGSDGVVRAAGANLNVTYLRFEPTPRAHELTTTEIRRLRDRARLPDDATFHELTTVSRPGVDGREVVPFAIPYDSSHTGGQTGIVDGSKNREQVEPLLRAALEARTLAQWRGRVRLFDQATVETRAKAAEGEISGLFGRKGWSRQAQYDGHSQLIVRLTDQDGRAVEALDVFFGRSTPAGEGSEVDLSDLIQHTHRNRRHGNVLTFYLRVERFDPATGTWRNRLDGVDGMVLEVSAEEPRTGEIQYVPFRHEFDAAALQELLVPHTTTIIDIQLLRVPSPDVVRIFRH